MIRAREVADFIRAANISLSGAGPAMALKIVPDDKVRQGDVIPTPDRLVAVTVTGGGPTLGERTRDRSTVQLVTRGKQQSDADAEDVASAADDVLMGAVAPLTMGAHHVIAIDYLGGPPAFIQRDTAQRALFACSYLIQTARSVT